MRPVPIRVIDGATVRRLLPYRECIDIIRRAMVAVSTGKAHLPLRHAMPVPGGSGLLGIMPGALTDPPCFGIKLVSLFPENRSLGLSSHLGAYLLYESAAGQPLALINGAELTAIRTAAATAVATLALMRPESAALTIIGTGEQARAHAHALLASHAFHRVLVWGRNPQKARDLIAEMSSQYAQVELAAAIDMRNALREADVVCTVTASGEPLLTADMVTAGTHLNLVGASFPDKREVDDSTVARGRYFVDYRGSALAQAGELLSAIKAGLITEKHIVAEIGEVIAGQASGRRCATEITIYKSLGIAAQDLGMSITRLRRSMPA